ncbi:glycosyl hydrolase 108 family protein [Novosphingobium sp. PS1R-30]|uniref:Glycosyl hydrolase 108 family protein n=1 Tax=Novosphingobium anseongense TaxID=3133436 RepID=A0ABU8RV85_9SPHN
MPKLGLRLAGAAGLIASVLAGLYAREGDYVNHKADRGGATRWGVTEVVARDFGYRGDMRVFPKHCDAVTPICADRIYTTLYIERPGYMPFAAIEPAVLDELVDSAVLHGPPRGSGWLQATLNEACGADLQVDGKVGARTVSAYETCQVRVGRVTACRLVLDTMDAKQAAFFRAIVARNPSQRVFLKGWLAHRVGNVDRAKCGKAA